MTKEDFWDEIEQKYPTAMQDFKTWIDQYKIDNMWDGLFNARIYNAGAGDSEFETLAPKYQDLPKAMQFGIFIEFAGTCVAVAYTKFEYPDTIEQYIDRCMDALQNRLDKQWQSIESVPVVEVLFEVKDDEGNIYKAIPIIKYCKKPPLINPIPTFTGLWRVQKDIPGKGNIVAWRYIIEK